MSIKNIKINNKSKDLLDKLPRKYEIHYSKEDYSKFIYLFLGLLIIFLGLIIYFVIIKNEVYDFGVFVILFIGILIIYVGIKSANNTNKKIEHPIITVSKEGVKIKNTFFIGWEKIYKTYIEKEVKESGIGEDETIKTCLDLKIIYCETINDRKEMEIEYQKNRWITFTTVHSTQEENKFKQNQILIDKYVPILNKIMGYLLELMRNLKNLLVSELSIDEEASEFKGIMQNIENLEGSPNEIANIISDYYTLWHHNNSKEKNNENILSYSN